MSFLLAVLPSVLAAGPAASAIRAEASLRAVVELLQPELAGAASSGKDERKDEQDELAWKLAALGSESIPSLLQVLCAGRVEAEWRTDGGPAAALPGRVDAALLDALALQPAGALFAHLELVAAAHPSEEERGAALRVLGAAGGGSELDLLVRFAAPPPSEKRGEGEEAGVPRPRRERFESALRSILAREPGAAFVLRDLFGEAHASLAAPIAECIGELCTAESLGLLASLFSQRCDADTLLLIEFAEAAACAPAPADEFATANVRSRLGAKDPSVVILAAQALALLEDDAAVNDLIGLLASDDGNVRRAAWVALKKITHRDLPLDIAAWDEWYEAELVWWDEDSAPCFRAMQHREPTVVLRAIGEASKHRLFRHEIARAIADCLANRQSSVVLVACEALAELGSAAAVPELERLLGHGDARVDAAARSALARITGRDPAAGEEPPRKKR